MKPDTVLRMLRRRLLGEYPPATNAIGVSRWTLFRAETRKHVSVKTRARLEEFFGCSWSELMADYVETPR